jgi:CubicO group peptidase (beta-lactamase class C family)
MSLNEYFQTHIFAPLNLHSISMFPTPQMKSQLAHMHQKATGPDGKQHVRARDHLYRRPLISSATEVSSVYNSAGAGCFARPTDYVQIISTLLNDGVSPTTHNRILSKTSMEEMFSNQISKFPDFGRKGIKSAKPTYTNDIPDMYPQPKEQPQGWGLTFMLTIHEGATGRGRNTAWWAGLPNLFWWADRENGIGGIFATQILPFGGK